MDSELEAFYQVIARTYDADYAGLLKGVDVAFYRDIALESGGPVLETGCGTGRVLLPLARAGVLIHGLDSSAAMLEQLQTSLRREPEDVRARVTVTQGDIRSTSLNRTFALVIAPGNVLHSFPDRAHQRAWLANARRHLVPGGALCFDVFQFDYRRLLAPGDEWVTDVDRTDPANGHRFRRFCRCEHEPELQRFRVWMRWLEEEPGGRTVSDTTAGCLQRWFTRGELECLLELESFRITAYWGDFNRAPFGRGSTNQVVLAVTPSS